MWGHGTTPVELANRAEAWLSYTYSGSLTYSIRALLPHMKIMYHWVSIRSMNTQYFVKYTNLIFCESNINIIISIEPKVHIATALNPSDTSKILS